MYRLPDAGKRLPPERWAEDFFPSHQVLVVIEVEASAGGVTSRGGVDWRSCPPAGDGGIEALVVETILVPGTDRDWQGSCCRRECGSWPELPG